MVSSILWIVWRDIAPAAATPNGRWSCALRSFPGKIQQKDLQLRLATARRETSRAMPVVKNQIATAFAFAALNKAA
jgi:hypothetical protein